MLLKPAYNDGAAWHCAECGQNATAYDYTLAVGFPADMAFFYQNYAGVRSILCRRCIDWTDDKIAEIVAGSEPI